MLDRGCDSGHRPEAGEARAWLCLPQLPEPHLHSESGAFETKQAWDGCGVKTQGFSSPFLGTGRRVIREPLSGVLAAVVSIEVSE